MNESTLSQDLSKVLNEINAKLQNAKALNGGFDALMIKINGIEDSQDKISKQVEKISDTLYDPDHGVFARIKNVESTNQQEHTKIVERLDTFSDERKEQDKVEEASEEDDENRDDRLNKLEVKVDDLSRWRKTWTSFALWAGGGMATGGLGLLAKILYTLFTHHTI